MKLKIAPDKNKWNRIIIRGLERRLLRHLFCIKYEFGELNTFLNFLKLNLKYAKLFIPSNNMRNKLRDKIC